jgi:hypothetical protein
MTPPSGFTPGPDARQSPAGARRRAKRAEHESEIIGLAVAAALIALGAYLYYDRQQAVVEAPPPAAAPAAPPAEEKAPEAQHPVPDSGSASEAALPAIDDSDTAMRDAIVGVFGSAADELLVPDSLVRRIVATIDGLPRNKLAVRMRPVTPAPGRFVVEATEEAEDTIVLSADNYARYAPAVSLLEKADTAQLVAAYLRFYPRFQQAYVQLGYPSGYFNDRLVEAIDDMLATPEAQTPIMLRRPNVLFEYADADLESRSVGQKLLLRMGPENAAVIKSKLREIRTEVTSHAPPG